MDTDMNDRGSQSDPIQGVKIVYPENFAGSEDIKLLSGAFFDAAFPNPDGISVTLQNWHIGKPIDDQKRIKNLTSSSLELVIPLNAFNTLFLTFGVEGANLRGSQDQLIRALKSIPSKVKTPNTSTPEVRAGDTQEAAEILKQRIAKLKSVTPLEIILLAANEIRVMRQSDIKAPLALSTVYDVIHIAAPEIFPTLEALIDVAEKEYAEKGKNASLRARGKINAPVREGFTVLAVRMFGRYRIKQLLAELGLENV